MRRALFPACALVSFFFFSRLSAAVGVESSVPYGGLLEELLGGMFDLHWEQEEEAFFDRGVHVPDGQLVDEVIMRCRNGASFACRANMVSVLVTSGAIQARVLFLLRCRVGRHRGARSVVAAAHRSTTTVRCAGWIRPGHERHHTPVVRLSWERTLTAEHLECLHSSNYVPTSQYFLSEYPVASLLHLREPSHTLEPRKRVESAMYSMTPEDATARFN